ncbi:hypothetical protein CDAR_494071 [Caerostris darwini]|uniref:Uncharacterized protein n=1 Tax=Caerostris darwini TaxID=1538125 RepID=A0AAV4MR39_9ARAC|nr:hypothetical protein CDAR_494071 [Caerostris darwini]
MLSVAYPIKFIKSPSAVNVGSVKRGKHSAGFKIKLIQFSKENGNHAAERIFDASESSLHRTEDDYLFINQSNGDGEEEKEFYDMPEDITDEDNDELFMLSKKKSS